jgi:hypothetical protein
LQLWLSGVNDCGDNSDEKGCPGSNGDAIGYIAAAVASVFFGTLAKTACFCFLPS